MLLVVLRPGAHRMQYLHFNVSFNYFTNYFELMWMNSLTFASLIFLSSKAKAAYKQQLFQTPTLC